MTRQHADLYIFPQHQAIIPHPDLPPTEAVQAQKEWLSWPEETPSKPRTAIIIHELESGTRVTRMQFPPQLVQRLPRAI